MTLSRRKSFGRFPRSVEMITHRPVIGSFRNSGKAILLEEFWPTREERVSQRDYKLYRVLRSREDAPAGHLHLRAERILVQPDHRGRPGQLSIAITSNRQGHSPTWHSARNRCAGRTTRY